MKFLKKLKFLEFIWNSVDFLKFCGIFEFRGIFKIQWSFWNLIIEMKNLGWNSCSISDHPLDVGRWYTVWYLFVNCLPYVTPKVSLLFIDESIMDSYMKKINVNYQNGIQNCRRFQQKQFSEYFHFINLSVVVHVHPIHYSMNERLSIVFPFRHICRIFVLKL